MNLEDFKNSQEENTHFQDIADKSGYSEFLKEQTINLAMNIVGKCTTFESRIMNTMVASGLLNVITRLFDILIMGSTKTNLSLHELSAVIENLDIRVKKLIKDRNESK